MPKLSETLTLADAKRMVLFAEAHAAQLGIDYAIAVVDCGGHLLHFSRGDACAAGCATLATDKAHTAAMFGHATDTLARLAQPAAALYGIQHALSGRAVVFGGGVPIRSNGVVIGAIGASAGSVEQDMAVAQAGILALGDLQTSTTQAHSSPAQRPT